MLTENKFSKYMIYAIGEIILVVIGILIALQVNNWNEARKELGQERIYLKNLQSDLKGIIEAYNVAIEYEELILKHSKELLKHYESNSGFYNMDTIFPKLNDLSLRWGTTANSTTLTEMINSGQTKLISNTDLRKNLIAFNEELKLWSTNTLNNNSNLVDRLISAGIVESGSFAIYSYSKSMDMTLKKIIALETIKVNDNELKSIFIENLNNPQNKLKILSFISFRHTLASLQKETNKAITQRTKNLITAIENELKKTTKDKLKTY